MSLLREVDINKDDLGIDARGKNKFSEDYSVIHGLWVVDVSDVIWIEYYNGTEQAKTNATSVDGELNLASNTGTAEVGSRRHPRYQPNRGLLYSTAVGLPVKAALAQRDFGTFNDQFGLFFRLKSGVLYACIRNTTTALVTTETEEAIDTSLIPGTVDFENGNIYSIRWCGISDIDFYIADPETDLNVLVHTMDLLGKEPSIGIGNPALPIRYLSKNLGDDAVLKSSGVDISIEGGEKEIRQRGVLVSEEITLTTSELPILLLHIPDTTTNGWINTRDLAMRRIRGYADENTLIRVYYSRDSTAFTGTTYTLTDTQGTQEYAIDTSIVWNGTGRQVNEDRIPALGSITLDNPDEVYGEFFLTHGDHFLVTLQAKNNSLGGVNMEWGVEV